MIDWLKANPYIVALLIVCLFGIAVSAMYFGVDLLPYVEAVKWW